MTLFVLLMENKLELDLSMSTRKHGKKFVKVALCQLAVGPGKVVRASHHAQMGCLQVPFEPSFKTNKPNFQWFRIETVYWQGKNLEFCWFQRSWRYSIQLNSIQFKILFP